MFANGIGTGRQSNWELAQRLAKEYRLILAGGLNAHNVRTAINTVHPYAVDAASGLEKSPGVKDAERIQQFLQECHDVN